MKLKQKIVAMLLTVILMSTNFVALGTQVIAASLEQQNSKTNHANVEFNSYFAGEVHSKTFHLQEEAKLYLSLKVSNIGYLKNAVVRITEANYQIDHGNLEENEKIQSASQDEIKLEQVNSGEEVLLELPISILAQEQVVSGYLDKTSQVTLTGIYVDENGKERNIEKTIQNQLTWEANPELELKGEVSKYIPYQQAEEYGVLVQTKLSSNLKDGVVPISKTQLSMQVPEIEGSKPQRVIVLANQTTATNQDENGNHFTNQNYNYNQETGNLTIEVENQADENSKIAWNQKGQDEYLVNFVYIGKDLYDKVVAEGFTSKMEVEGIITVANVETQTVQNKITVEYNQKETMGLLTDVELVADKQLSKGYLYANTIAEAKKQETPYTVEYKIQVNDVTLLENLTVQTVGEKYSNSEEEEVAIGKGSYIQNLTVDKESFEKVLGAQGVMEVTTVEGTTLAVLAPQENETNTQEQTDSLKQTENVSLDEQENYVIDLAQLKINEVIIKTSKPVAEGNLFITANKALTTEQSYTKTQLKDFSKIVLGVINPNNEEKVQYNNTIQLVETQSKAQVSIDNANLSTVVENKDVEIRAVLDTSSLYNALYQNPVLKIKLPSSIEKIDIKNYNMLMENGLEIKEIKQTKEDDCIVITITLEGTQTQYTLEAEYQGTIIILKADITVDTLTPSSVSQIEMTYTNESEFSSNKEGKAQTQIKFVAPTGVVAVQGIENYADGKPAIFSMADEEIVADLSIYAKERAVIISGKIINNYPNEISDIGILGRIPKNGNQSFSDDYEIESNFDTTLTKGIALSGIDSKNYTVYYSNKVDATKDLDNPENGWTKNPTAQAKSYYIVLNNYTMKAGEVIDFAYEVEIPANLTRNKQTYSFYQVSYQNDSSIGTLAETEYSPVIAMSTGEGPVLEASVSSPVTTAKDGQILRFTVTVKNTGTTDAKNVQIHITAPEDTVHTEIVSGENHYTDSENTEKIITIENLKAGETATRDYELRTRGAYGRQVNSFVTVTAEELETPITSNTCTVSVSEGKIEVINTFSVAESYVLNQGSKFYYQISLRDIAEQDLQNVTADVRIPEGIKITDVYYSDDVIFREKNRQNITIDGQDIKVNVGELESLVAYAGSTENPDEPTLVDLRTTAYIRIELEVDTFQGKHTAIVTATADGVEEHTSNYRTFTVASPKLTIVQQELQNRYIKENTEYTYHFTIKNVGDIYAKNNKFTMQLPEGLSFVNAKYQYNDTDYELKVANNGRFSITVLNLAPEEELDIAVTVKADWLPDKNDKTVVTSATLEAEGFNQITSNQVTAIIEYDPSAQRPTDPSNPSDPDNPNIPITNRYKITGTAWLDANQNGEREETEQVLSGIRTILIQKSNNQIVQDPDSGENKVVTTNSNGQYEFNNLPVGDYLVIFAYDASRYSITQYRQEGVSTNFNSDAINITITLDGEKTVAGITDVLSITNENIRDIDIGLYAAEKFDLRLDKYISKITLTTPTIGTSVRELGREDFSKVEVLASNLGRSSMIIEYKIVVTNEGAVPGYAKKIVDYLPEEVGFNTELNQDWYLSDNQNVYNTSLANTVIQPGESKELTLILTKQITESSLGTFNNQAEIYESYNEQGLEDIDSTPGNKVGEEDDLSQANIMISIVTGKIVLYTTLIASVLFLLVLGIILIKKKVLTVKRKEK